MFAARKAYMCKNQIYTSLVFRLNYIIFYFDLLLDLNQYGALILLSMVQLLVFFLLSFQPSTYVSLQFIDHLCFNVMSHL